MTPIKLNVKTEAVELSENLYLVEFAPKSEKTEIISVGDKTATLSGIAIYRLIDTAHNEVAKQDSKTLHTDLSALIGKKNVVLAYAHPPYNGSKQYFWKLFKLSTISEASDIIKIDSTCIATKNQEVELNKKFPGWMDAVKKLDNVTAI